MVKIHKTEFWDVNSCFQHIFVGLAVLYSICICSLRLPSKFYVERGNLDDKEGEVCRSIRHYLIQHFLEDHTLQKLSRHFGINPNKLMYLFRKAFNKSVFEYLAELRMEFAKRLLQKGNMRVVDVARAIGYKNPNHFSTAFKRRFGVSPTAIK